MYEDYADYEEVTYNNNYFDKKKIVLIVIILSLIIGGYFLYQIFFNRDYSYYEKKMVEDAKSFVEINKLNLSREIYLDISRIKTEIPTNCSNTSGVFYNGNTYKAYLSCSDYESKIIDNNSKEMNLLGNDIIILIKGMEYTEAGYISINDVKIDGDVGSEEGVYTINYFSLNDVVTRKVVIINNMSLKRELPTLSLIGEKQVILKLKEEYMEQGVLASDDMDGNITSQVNIKSNVNSYQEGEYQTVYTVRNSRGYQNYIVRKINVIGDSNLNIISDLSNNNLTNQNVKIIINIIGDNYQYAILPNEEKKYEKNFEYEVKENGEYKFLVYDKNNQVIEKIIHVNNINHDKPSGTCMATLSNSQTDITVNPISSNIIGYKYVLDSWESDYFVNNTYTSGISKPQNVYVKIKNMLGSEDTIKCKITDNILKVDPNGVKRTLSGSKLEMPITSALSRRGHTVYDLNACIYNKVLEAGPGTRYGVVAAGVALLDCTKEMTGYVYSYDHCGAKLTDEDNCRNNPDICGRLGINSKFGTISEGGCCASGKNYCYSGFNCATFVRWSMCNGGMNLCKGGSSGATSLSSEKFFPGGDSFEIRRGKVTYKYGNNLTSNSVYTLFHMIKPGDIIHTYRTDDNNGSSDHVVLVVGIENDLLYYAENGNAIKTLSYNSFLNGGSTGTAVYHVVLLENYYNNVNNRNNLYP